MPSFVALSSQAILSSPKGYTVKYVHQLLKQLCIKKALLFLLMDRTCQGSGLFLLMNFQTLVIFLDAKPKAGPLKAKEGPGEKFW